MAADANAAGVAEQLLQRVTEALRHAQALLITSGAGMGVDSGFGTFRGRNAGVWPQLRIMGIDYSTMTRPSWFTKDPRLAWAYWRFVYQLYTQTPPHAGYELLAKWGKNCEWGCFSVTSNIDGHWCQTLGTQRSLEVHGSVTHMQCVEFDGRVWPAHSTVNGLLVPAWALEPGEPVDVLDHHSKWVPAFVGQDGAGVVSPDGKSMKTRGVRRPDGPDLVRVAEASVLPMCLESGRLARPNVVMFDDTSVSMRRIDEQTLAFEAWLRELPTNVRLVIIEIGAGKTVPTIRNDSEASASKFPNSTLVRINWDDSDVPEHLKERSVSIAGVGALEALTQIDTYLTG